MIEYEEQLIAIFLNEAEDFLVEIENLFLNINVDKNISDKFNIIFRFVHTMKGSAKAVGFIDLSDLTHIFESLLVLLRENKQELNDIWIDFLLARVDFIKNMLNKYKCDSLIKIDISTEIKLLQEKIDILKKDININVSDEINLVADAELEGVLWAVVVPNSIVSKKSCEIKECKKINIDETMRVSVNRIDKLVNGIGELVIIKSILCEHKKDFSSALLQRTLTQLDKISNEIRDIAISLRMVPIKIVFQKMQRIVHDLSISLHKNVLLVIEGDETELDRTILEQLSDPLLHLIRNAIDHGIETPAERIALSKPNVAKLVLKAAHVSGKIAIDIIDDGKGIDIEKVVNKAKKLKLIADDAVLNEKASLELIFLSGLSTKSDVSDISGRGVGMDVVHENIKKMQGEIEIKTVKNEGTFFRIYLPLTMSILDAMIVVIGFERYVIPVNNIDESFRPQKDNVGFIAEQGEFINLRGEILPLFRLKKILNIRDTVEKEPWNGIVLIIRNRKSKSYSVLVDDIISKQQIVIKSLSEEIKNLAGFGGSAILGDGKPALILDLDVLVSL